MRMLHQLNPLTAALESIQHQMSDAFKRELTMAIEDMRSNYATQKKMVFEAKRLHEIVFKHTGVFCQWHLDVGNKSVNAAIMPAWIDTNNPLINRWNRWEIGSKDGEAALAWAGQGVEGVVDLEEGRVSGIYSKLVNPSWLTEGALYGNLLTAGEVAALVGHEVGHFVTMCQAIGQIDTSCMILATAARASIGAMPRKERVKFYSAIQKATGVDVTNDPEALNSTSEPVIQAVLTSAVNEHFRSEFGTELYDLRTWESLSDQFAARHGFALDLATSLDKMYRIYDPIAYRSTPVYLLVEMLKLVGSVIVAIGLTFSAPITAVILIPILLSINPHARAYDRPQERIARIRRDLVAATKDKALPKAKVESILKDINVLDAILKDVKLRESFYEKIWAFFSAYTRDQNRAMRELQALEELINNDMFVAAAELRTLAN